MIINEYINIFNIIRIPLFYDFIKYFKTIKEKFNNQETESKININEYLEQIENISQEIIIIMVFNIETTLNEIEEKKNIFIKYLKINNMDIEIFNTIKKEI